MLPLVKAGVHNSVEQQVASTETRADCLISLLLNHLSRQDAARMPSIHSLAGSLNLSASHLRHVVKQKTGVSYGRYIKILRLRRARQLLQETFLTVKQVMLEVGVSDHSHFARDYKKVFGESPTQTRDNAIATRQEIRSSRPRNSNSGHKQSLAMAACNGSFNVTVNYSRKKFQSP